MKTTLFLGFGVLFWVSGVATRIQTLKYVCKLFFEWDMHSWKYPTYSYQTKLICQFAIWLPGRGSGRARPPPPEPPRRSPPHRSPPRRRPPRRSPSSSGGGGSGSSSAPGVQTLSPPCRRSVSTSGSQSQKSFQYNNIILYNIDTELRESANGNNHFSPCCGSFDSSLINGQHVICKKATDTRKSTFGRAWNKGDSGRQDIIS